MKKSLLLTAVLAGLATGSVSSQAAMVFFNDVTNQNTIGLLDATYDFGDITATAGQASGSAKSLTVANFSYNSPSEVGLGVCGSSDTTSLCGSTVSKGVNKSSGSWDGDVTEIDNNGNSEYITLQAENFKAMTGKFVFGSLDRNDTTTNDEDGYVSYTNDKGQASIVRFAAAADPAGAIVTSGNATITKATQVNTGASHGWGTEVFLLTINDFWKATPNVVQIGAGGGGGTNNDFLLTAADLKPVPVPAAVWLLGSALGAVGAAGRRRKA